LEGNILAIDTPVYEDIEEISSFVVAVSSSLDVPLWRSSGVLRQGADHLVSQAWREIFVPIKEEEVSRRTSIFGPVGLSPLDITPITWEYPSKGICKLDLFGGISTGLATVLQAGILVRKYFYVERDEAARRVSSRHLALLMRRYPELLPRSAIRGYQRALPLDIALLGAHDIAKVGPIDLVIAGWPCQGHTRAGRGEGLHDLRSHMFWEMLQVLRHLQTHQVRVPAYILENVPLLGDIRSHVVASVHEIRSWIGPAVLLDVVRVGSHAHHPRLWWTNLLPREVLKHAYETMSRSSHLIVDSILDIGRRSQVVRVVDRSPMAMLNQVGQPRMALPTFVSFPTSHAYKEGGAGLVWDTCSQRLVEPNADEREHAMGFPTGVTSVPSISEASRRQMLGQAMDLNCLTWIVSLGMAEQRRLRATSIIMTPLVSSLPTVTVEASTGGEESCTFHPWSTWDVLGEHVEVVAHVVGGVC
jgi:hypothetical protein